MNLFAVASLILGITSILLAFVVWIYGKRNELHTVWGLFNFSVSIWGIGCFIVGTASDETTALNAWKFAHIGGLFISIFFYHMVCAFSKLDRKKSTIAAYLFGVFFNVINFTTDYLINKTRIIYGIYFNDATVLYFIAVSLWVSLTMWSFIDLVKYFLITKGIKRTQTIYIILGFLIGFCGGITNFIPMFGIDIYPFGNITIPIYCLISTYAILRYRLMDINLVFRKSMVYSLSAGILTSLFVVIVISMTKFLTDVAGIRSYTILAVASLIIAILFNPLRNRIQHLVDKRFYKRSYDYYSTIQQVSSTLASMFSRENIIKFIGNIVYEVLGLEGVYMLAAAPAEGSYEIVHHMSKEDGGKLYPVTEDGKRLNINEASSVIEILSRSKDIVIKDEFPLLEERFGPQVVEEFRTEMEKFDGAVMMPVFVDGKLSFVMVLGEKLSGDMFTSEDINLLNTIADQMAIAFKNAQFYAGRMQTERLASIGMMSATFAHEIRNPLTSLKTFAQLMPEKYNDPEFRDTFSKIVEGEIEKIDTLIGDLLDFSTEKKSARVNEFNIVELVNETLDYIKSKVGPQKKNIDVVRRYHENVIDMSGDATKLKQAFGIIIMNGYQAMNGSGKLTVDIRKNAESVDVAISDTGEGIPHEDISKIFDPFVTTKEMGVGLGLAITKRVIEDHEGRIHVRSRLAEGTTFTISLPVKT